MPIYKCEKCNFLTDIKCHYQRHENTSKHKRNMGEIEESKTNQKPINMQPVGIQKPTDMQPELVLYECDYCDSVFKHTQSKYKHQKYRCKARKIQEQKLKDMEERHRIELMERDKTIEYLSKKLDKAIDRIGNTTNNIDNSNNLNITIKAYGQEDLSYLKNVDWLKMLSSPQDSIVNLFVETHFNPEHPENANIRLRNRNSKFLEVHDGDNWKNKVKKKMLNEIADDKQVILEKKYDKLQDDMSHRQKDNHAVYHDDVYYDQKKDIIEELEGILLDNK